MSQSRSRRAETELAYRLRHDHYCFTDITQNRAMPSFTTTTNIPWATILKRVFHNRCFQRDKKAQDIEFFFIERICYIFFSFYCHYDETHESNTHISRLFSFSFHADTTCAWPRHIYHWEYHKICLFSFMPLPFQPHWQRHTWLFLFMPLRQCHADETDRRKKEAMSGAAFLFIWYMERFFTPAFIYYYYYFRLFHRHENEWKFFSCCRGEIFLWAFYFTRCESLWHLFLFFFSFHFMLLLPHIELKRESWREDTGHSEAAFSFLYSLFYLSGAE